MHLNARFATRSDPYSAAPRCCSRIRVPNGDPICTPKLSGHAGCRLFLSKTTLCSAGRLRNILHFLALIKVQRRSFQVFPHIGQHFGVQRIYHLGRNGVADGAEAVTVESFNGLLDGLQADCAGVAASFSDRCDGAVRVGSFCFLWGIIMICSGFANNWEQLVAARVFLGLFNTAFFPAYVYPLSTRYTRCKQSGLHTHYLSLSGFR